MDKNKFKITLKSPHKKINNNDNKKIKEIKKRINEKIAIEEFIPIIKNIDKNSIYLNSLNKNIISFINEKLAKEEKITDNELIEKTIKLKDKKWENKITVYDEDKLNEYTKKLLSNEKIYKFNKNLLDDLFFINNIIGKILDKNIDRKKLIETIKKNKKIKNKERIISIIQNKEKLEKQLKILFSYSQKVNKNLNEYVDLFTNSIKYNPIAKLLKDIILKIFKFIFKLFNIDKKFLNKMVDPEKIKSTLGNLSVKVKLIFIYGVGILLSNYLSVVILKYIIKAIILAFFPEDIKKKVRENEVKSITGSLNFIKYNLTKNKGIDYLISDILSNIRNNTYNEFYFIKDFINTDEYYYYEKNNKDLPLIAYILIIFFGLYIMFLGIMNYYILFNLIVYSLKTFVEGYWSE